MSDTTYLTDETILAQLGQRLEAARLARNLTQAQLARRAGVGKRTVERLEEGNSVQLTSLIRVLRALDLLDRLEQALPPARPGPVALLRRGGKRPQRASGKKRETPGRWTWGEDD